MWDLETIRRMNNEPRQGTRTGEATKPVTTSTEDGGKRSGHPEFYKLLDEIGELHNCKNYDYADGGEQGPLGNFRRISAIKRLYPESTVWTTPTGVAITYALKQLDAALILLTTGKTSKTGEGLNERLRDIAIYSLLSIILDKETN